MSRSLLERIERHSWRMSHRDGLLDLLFGFMLLGAGVSSLATVWEWPDGVRLLCLVAIQFGGVGFVWWMRKREVVPRVGRVKFSSQRVRRTRSVRIFMGACVALTVLLVVLTARARLLGTTLFGDADALVVWIVVAWVILVPVGALAVFLDYPRLLLHGGLFVLVEFCLLVLGWDDATPYAAPMLLGAGSLISFGIGIVAFGRFLRSIPRGTDCKIGGPHA